MDISYGECDSISGLAAAGCLVARVRAEKNVQNGSGGAVRTCGVLLPCSLVLSVTFWKVLRLGTGRASTCAASLLQLPYSDLRHPLNRREWCADASQEVAVMRSALPRRSVALVGRQEE